MEIKNKPEKKEVKPPPEKKFEIIDKYPNDIKDAYDPKDKNKSKDEIKKVKEDDKN